MRVGCSQCKVSLIEEDTMHYHMRKHHKIETQTKKGESPTNKKNGDNNKKKEGNFFDIIKQVGSKT